MAFLTVITPTYNRAHTLPNLFDSLLSQSCKDFEWLIIDDGSVDNTEQVVASFSAEFVIRYIRKENGGKHTALNLGIKTIFTDLTIIVDSDDQLLPTAVEQIGMSFCKYKDYQKIGALCFLKCYRNGTPIITMDQEEFVDTYINYRIKENRPGDMAEVFWTKVLKEHPFPEFSGERFLSEDVVWIEVGKSYQFAFVNQPIYVCEYLEGGLTYNDKPMKFASPKGSMLRGKQLMSKECGFRVNIKGAIIYNCYSANVDNLPAVLHVNRIREKVLLFCTKIPSIYFRRKWKKNLKCIRS